MSGMRKKRGKRKDIRRLPRKKTSMKPNTKRAMGGSKRQAGIGLRDERGKEAEYQRTAQHVPNGSHDSAPTALSTRSQANLQASLQFAGLLRSKKKEKKHGKPIHYDPPRRSEEPFDTTETLPIGERYYHASEDEEASERGDESQTPMP